MKRKIQLYLLLVVMTVTARSAFGAGAQIKNVGVSPDGNEFRIEVELSSPVSPKIIPLEKPDRLIVDFPDVSPKEQLEQFAINKNGVKRIRVGLNRAIPPITRMVIDLDSARPFSVQILGNKFILRILPLPSVAGSTGGEKTEPAPLPTSAAVQAPAPIASPMPELSKSSDSSSNRPQQEAVATAAKDNQMRRPTVRSSFKIKYVAGNTAYIDGGSNSGLQEGMNLVVRDPHPVVATADRSDAQGAACANVRVIGVAATSAIAEVRSSNRQLKIGDTAELIPEDARVAAGKVLSATATQLRSALTPSDSTSRPPAQLETVERTFVPGHSTDSPPSGQFENVERGRMAGRFSLDYSGVSSSGSTPGTSTQVGVSFQSDMTHIMGTHWNLEGYWRGRINRHSQFQQATIEDTLNKTYTMQLYYDNPDSKWVAGVGRLYLPWAVSLDTIDGGYLGRKVASKVTTGIFAGSTPDLTSWDYRPDHRIAGSFINFEGGAYEGFHYTSTSGLALSTVNWKLDRPYVFFENEVSYKGKFSVYHSLIADSPQGVTTDGIRPGAGISHSYLTVHFQPQHRVSFDVYHNYFRDVPTAATSIVGTGLVDKLLFQGVNAGVHVQPVRNVTLYTSIGTSEKTGDTHRSLNQMYGASWSEIAHSGIRADFHYSKFDSNFGSGDYRVLSLSRQVTNRMFWNLQLGNQDLLSAVTMNNRSNFIANSMDINMGKHSYIQSGYTYVNGAALNYRQWYVSWGYRFDKKQTENEFVQSPDSKH
jgi:AMIN domain